MAVGGF